MTSAYWDQSYPPSLFGGPPAAAVKGAVKPGDGFPADPAITAEDAANAAKLAGAGYIVAGTEAAAWTAGAREAFTIGGFTFHWDGAKWAPGRATGAAPAPPADDPRKRRTRKAS